MVRKLAAFLLLFAGLAVAQAPPGYSSNGIGLPTGPTTPNGVPQGMTSTPSGGVAGAGTWVLPGLLGRAVTVTTTDVLGSTDCMPKRIQYSGGSATPITLPTAVTLGVPNCIFRIVNNLSTVADLTITTTTWTCNGAATCVIHNGQEAFIGVDPNSATNWTADIFEQGLTAGSGVTFTRSATGLSVASAPLACADVSASGTAQSCTTSPSFTPAANNCVLYTTTTTNSGTGLTTNINALGAKSIAIPGASGWTTTLTASIIPANKPLLACYDGTNWNVQQTGTAATGAAYNLGAINAIGTAGSTQTIALTNGAVQSMTLSANLTISFTQPVGYVGLVRLQITQAGGGGDTVTWTSVKWPGGVAPVMTSTASAVDWYSCVLDGTNTYCTAGQSFQ